MRIVFVLSFVVFKMTWLNMQEQSFRVLNTFLHNHLFTSLVKIDDRNIELRSYFLYNSRVISVLIHELSGLIKLSPHHWCNQNRNAALASRVFNISNQVVAVQGMGRRGSRAVLDLLIIVTKLYENVISWVHATHNGIPTMFIQEAFGTAAVNSVILDRNLFGKKLWKQLAPAAFRVCFEWL